MWLGCAVAMTGTVLLTLDHAPQAASSGLQQAVIGAHPSECVPMTTSITLHVLASFNRAWEPVALANRHHSTFAYFS